MLVKPRSIAKKVWPTRPCGREPSGNISPETSRGAASRASLRSSATTNVRPGRRIGGFVARLAKYAADVFNGERDATREGIHFKPRNAGNLRKLFGDDDAARVREGASGLPAFTVADRMLQIELHLLFASEKPSSMSPDPFRGTRRAGFAKKNWLVRSAFRKGAGTPLQGGRFFNGYREAFCLD